MEKKRVELGERYWYISSLLEVENIRDIGHYLDRLYYERNNYFQTQAEAESMARKIRAVLNGAEVIEMPSENEFNTGEETYIQEGYSEGEYCHKQSFCWGFQEGIEWLKSKTIK